MKEAKKGLIAGTASVKDESKLKAKREADRLYKRMIRGSVKEILKSNTGGRNFKRDESGAITDKICTICDTWKPIDCFNKRRDTPSGVRPFCIPCQKEMHRNRPKISTAKTKTKDCRRCGKSFSFTGGLRKFCGEECASASLRDKQRIESNSIHFATHAKCKRCNQTKPLKDFDWLGNGFKILPSACSECKESKFKKARKKRNNNPKNRIRRHLSKRMREMINQSCNGGTKNLRDALGCSSAFLRLHIQSQFTRCMSWNNYGTHWHVDHIVPCAAFDHSDPDQVKRCWHYSNLRPLEAEKNLEKSDKIIDCQPELLLQLT